MALQQITFNNYEKLKMNKTFIKFLRESLNECFAIYGWHLNSFEDGTLSDMFIHGWYTLKQLPPEFKIYGPDEVKSVFITAPVYETSKYQKLDLLVNNWYGVVIKFEKDVCLIDVCEFIICLQNKFGCKIQMVDGHPTEDIYTDDILYCIRRAANTEINMNWLKRYVSETENISNIQFIFDNINTQFMNSEFNELKAMCLRRLNPRNEIIGL